MQAIFEKIITPGHSSFGCRLHEGRAFAFPWHFHPELELTLILESRGRRFVGDHIADFEEGDLVFLGPNLPHFWYNSPKPRQRARSIVVQFRRDFPGAEFFKMPEARPLARLFDKACNGLQVTGKSRDQIAAEMSALVSLTGMAKLLKLLEILHRVASANRLRALSSPAFAPNLNRFDEARIGKVCQFINEHFARAIRQTDAARLAHMTPPAFSRFFKMKTGRTYSAFVNEVRIGHSCKLLIGSSLNCTEICFASGFENISNFNRRFRELKKTSPREFRAKFTNIS